MDDRMGTSAVTTQTIRLDKARGQIHNGEAQRMNCNVTRKTSSEIYLGVTLLYPELKDWEAQALSSLLSLTFLSVPTFKLA